jgi:ketosteroid isomerase-like protein
VRHLIAAALFLVPNSAAAQPTADQALIRREIEAGARACESGRPDDIMRSYARDILLSFPGVPDQDYDSILAGYRRLCAGSSGGEGTVETTRGEFQEILVSGDLAVVRVIWNTHLRGMPAGSVRRLQDLQVWRRTDQGWRFSRGVHFPVQ